MCRTTEIAIICALLYYITQLHIFLNLYSSKVWSKFTSGCKNQVNKFNLQKKQEPHCVKLLLRRYTQIVRSGQPSLLPERTQLTLGEELQYIARLQQDRTSRVNISPIHCKVPSSELKRFVQWSWHIAAFPLGLVILCTGGVPFIRFTNY